MARTAFVAVAACAAGLAWSFAATAAGHVPTASTVVFVDWARTHAAPAPACTPRLERKAANAIRAVVGDARVVALGEPIHGAHEPLALRNCLFRHLVEDEGFTAIALESGMHEARALQAYVSGGPGDPQALARAHLTWGFGRFSENVELLRWIHDRNASSAQRRKIAVYGIDMSGGDASGDWPRAPQVLKAGLDYLERWAPRGSAGVRAELAPYLDRFNRPAYRRLPKRGRLRLRSALGRACDFFDRHGTELAARTGRDSYEAARRDLVLAQQLAELFDASLAEPPGEDLTPQSYRSDEVRDAAMAANLRWVLKREGPQGRVLLFAHNGHIMNEATHGGIWSIYARPATSMGQHLRAGLGRRLVIILTSSAAAGPDLGARHDGLGSFDTALAAAATRRGDYLLDLRQARAAPGAAAWLAQPRSIRTNYTTEQLLTPRTAADAVIHIDRLTRAETTAP